MVRLDLDPARGDDCHGDGGDHEPEGEVEEGLLVGEHVQEGGEPGVELVKSLDRALLLPETWGLDYMSPGWGWTYLV